MRIIDILKEAPITDYSFQGSDEPLAFDRPGTIQTAKSQKAKEKAVRMFQNTPYNIRILFLNQERNPESIAGNRPGEITHPNNITRKHWFGNITGKEFPGTPGAITFVINSDHGTDYMPFTPWIIAHRMGHALSGARIQHNEPKFKTLYNRFIDGILYKITSELSNGGMVNEYQGVVGVLCQAGKFKSARDNRFRNSGEFVLECFAQFLIQGKVSFNEIKNPIEERTYPQDDKSHGIGGNPVAIHKQNLIEINKILKEAETMLNTEFDIIMKSMIGKVIAI